MLKDNHNTAVGILRASIENVGDLLDIWDYPHNRLSLLFRTLAIRI